MKKYRISYSEEVSEEDIKGMTEGGSLDDYLWEALRPEGDEWTVEEIE